MEWCRFHYTWFLPVWRYASASLCDSNVSVRPSVRPSVCPSGAGILSEQRKQSKPAISSPSGSPTILVFWCQISSRHSKGFPRAGASYKGGVGFLSLIIIIITPTLLSLQWRGEMNAAHRARWPPTSGLSPPLDCRWPALTIPVIITQLESWYSFYCAAEGGRLSRPRWLARYPDGVPARRQSPIQVLTGPGVW